MGRMTSRTRSVIFAVMVCLALFAFYQQATHVTSRLVPLLSSHARNGIMELGMEEGLEDFEESDDEVEEDEELKQHGGKHQNSSSPNYSRFQCSGDGRETRSCHFHNVCYKLPDVLDHEQVYFFAAVEGVTPEILEVALNPTPVRGELQETLDFVVKTAPVPTDNVVWVHKPHLRVEGKGENNFGHILVDVLFPIWYIKAAYGIKSDVQIISNNPEKAGYLSRDSYKMTKKSLFSLITGLTPSTLPAFLQQHHFKHAQWVCFSSFLAGVGDHGLLYPSISGLNKGLKSTHMRLPSWRAFKRAIMLRLHLKPKKAVPRRPVVTIYKHQSRMMDNFNEILQALVAKLPHADVRVPEMPTMSFREQIEVMQATTVYLCWYGGASFVGLFLPPGAQVVYLSDWEFDKQRAPPQRFFGATEKHQFWQFLPDITVFSYQFGAASAVPGQPMKETPTTDLKTLKPWNMTVFFDPGKIVRLVTSALANAQTHTP